MKCAILLLYTHSPIMCVRVCACVLTLLVSARMCVTNLFMNRSFNDYSCYQQLILIMDNSSRRL